MAVKAKVYLAVEGYDWEGFNVLGVYRKPEDALARVNDTKGYCDYVEIQVFQLGGERLEDDPAELYRRVRG